MMIPGMGGPGGGDTMDFEWPADNDATGGNLSISIRCYKTLRYKLCVGGAREDARVPPVLGDEELGVETTERHFHLLRSRGRP